MLPFNISNSKQVQLGNDSILVFTPSVQLINEVLPTDPKYQIRTLKTNELIKELRVYNHAIINTNDTKVLPDAFLDASFSLKPDKTKFVEAMNWLPQINIIDLKSGKINGFRLKDYQNEDIYTTSMENAAFCYKCVVSNDKFIYALWAGQKKRDLHPDIGYHFIHVFDWQGNYVHKFKLKDAINDLSINASDGRLYGWNIEKQVLYKYKVPL